MKEINLTLVKNAEGYTVSEKTEDDTLTYLFDDSDENRKQLVEFLINEFLNKEVENGRKYR